MLVAVGWRFHGGSYSHHTILWKQSFGYGCLAYTGLLIPWFMSPEYVYR